MRPRHPRALIAIMGAALCVLVFPPPAALADPPAQSLALPIAAGRIVDVARIPEPNWLPGHRGIDIAAHLGDHVIAPGSGRVDFAGTVAGRPVMAIELDVGLRATVEPVLAAIPVGTMVRKGDHVGTVAEDAGHCGARPCVHFGLKRGERYVDPLDWLEGYGRIVLLPRSVAMRTRPWTAGSRAVS